MIDALAAEWYKLRTVRSTAAVFGAVGAFMLLCVLYSWYVRHYWDVLSADALTLITYGVGAVLRSTAATIASMLAMLIVAPVLTRPLPSPWDDRAWSLLPEALAGQIAPAPGTPSGGGLLPGPVAAALLAGYAAAALAVGAYSFARRDA